jgi:hypothetical protein
VGKPVEVRALSAAPPESRQASALRAPQGRTEQAAWCVGFANQWGMRSVLAVHPHFFLPQSSSAGGADGADTFEDDIHNGSALIGAQQDCLLRSSFALAFFDLDLLLLLRDLRWLW